MAAVNLPVAQAAHTVAAVAAAYRPEEQPEQALAAAAEYWPEGQLRHDPAAAAEYLPEAQLEQAELLTVGT